MATFYHYFRENMQSLGLPAPESLFGTLQMPLSSAATFIGHIDKFGKRVTIRELIGAGLRIEKLSMIATLSAAFYVGAVIGSIAVASGRTLSDGSSLADVLWNLQCRGLNRHWLAEIMRRHPVVYDKTIVGRSAYRSRMMR